MRGRTGCIVGSGYIRAAELGYLVDECLPSCAATNIAAVEENVAIGIETLPNLRKVRRTCVQARFIEGKAAKCHLPGQPVTDDMDGIDAGASRQVVADLLQTIACGVEHHHFGARLYARQQLLVVLDLPVDEHDFLTVVGSACRRRR